MNDEQSFLQAIESNPHNDQLKLVFADWLEERGDPRASLLRLVVSRSYKKWAKAHVEASLHPHPDVKWALVLPVEEFLRHAREITEIYNVRVIKLTGLAYPSGLVDQLAACPFVAQLQGINLAGNAIGDHGAEVLAHSPYLTNLVSLSLEHAGLAAR